MSSIERRCAGCGSLMAAARIVERGHHGIRYDLEYRLPETSIEALGGAVPANGRVSAFVCGQCGHIALFAVAVVDAIEQREGPEPCLSCGTPIPVEADRCTACGWTWLEADPTPHA